MTKEISQKTPIRQGAGFTTLSPFAARAEKGEQEMRNMTNIDSYRSLTVILAAASLVLPIGSLCHATGMVVFECDFEDATIPGEITGAGQIVGTQGYAPFGVGDWFLQNSTGGIPMGTPGDQTVLTLSGLPFHTHIEIRMDLAVIDSWDGDYVEEPEIWSPDYFNVTVDGLLAFRETISSWGDDQSFAPEPEQIIVLKEKLFVSQNTEVKVI